MLKVNKILCPTDFSAASTAALTRARALAQLFGAELHVLHAVVLREDPPDGFRYGFPEDAQLLRRIMETAERRMADSIGSVSNGSGGEARLVTEIRQARSVIPAILDHASEIDADMIVIGSQGLRGASRLLLGSVAELVVRHATCPVLTVHEQDSPRPLDKLERIMVPVDFSDHSQAAIDTACKLAAASPALIELVHAVETDHLPQFYGPHGLEQLAQRVAAEAKTRLEQLAEPLRENGLAVETTVQVGQAARIAAQLAEHGGTDLIVLTSHGRTGLKRFLMGSTSERIVRYSEVPVLTIKTFGKQLLTSAAAEPLSEAG